MKKTIFLALLLISYSGFAQTSVKTQAEKPGISVKKITERFLKTPSVKNAVTGIHIKALGKKKNIVCHNENKLMIPASTMKTLYAFYALETFGNDFRWETSMVYSGAIENGVLHGHLILRAGGDPAFGGQIDTKDYKTLIAEMINALKNKGISEIEGNFIMQLPGNRYPAHGSWPIEDIGNYYGTGAWGFNFNDNLYKLFIRTGKPGEPLQIVRTEPEIPGLKISVRGTTAPPGADDTSYLYADPTSYTQTLIGQIPQTKSLYVIKGAIPNPPQTFLRILENEIRNNHIHINGQVRLSYAYDYYENEQLLWRHFSPKLIDIVKRTIDKSVNLYSEALARLVIEKNKTSDHYLNKEEINAYFKSKGFRLIDLEDGCGLAPDNLIAPVEFTRFFDDMVRKKGTDYVLDILSRGGKDGYAQYFLKNSPVQSRVWLKSGSVSKVMNYVGVFQGLSGKYYGFAIMVNHFSDKHKTVKKEIEKYLENLIFKL